MHYYIAYLMAGCSLLCCLCHCTTVVPGNPSPVQQHQLATMSQPPTRGSGFRLHNVKLYSSHSPNLFGQTGYVDWQGSTLTAVQAGQPEKTNPSQHIFDGQGRVLTPGLIDMHSHLGVYSLPHIEALEDGNEATHPITPDMRACDALRADDPTIDLARTYGGITTALVLPGSANLIGGQACLVKLRRFADGKGLVPIPSPPLIKLACGENPKRVYGTRQQMPSTRMGNLALLRRKLLEVQQNKAPEKITEEWKLLQAILQGQAKAHVHCYTAIDMHRMLDLAQEFDFHIQAFHHAVEAFRLRDRLQQEQVGVATWIDWWGFKMEARQPSFANLALLEQQHVTAAIHSDSERDIQHLHQEAAKGQAVAKALDIPVSDPQAIAWITSNPAKLLGIDQWVGSLEIGKHADMVLWNRDPLDSRAAPVAVWIEGQLIYPQTEAQLQQILSKPPSF